MMEEQGSTKPSGLEMSMEGEEERMEELSGLRWEMRKIKERLKREGCLSAME